jgi:hypothetical protein
MSSKTNSSVYSLSKHHDSKSRKHLKKKKDAEKMLSASKVEVIMEEPQLEENAEKMDVHSAKIPGTRSLNTRVLSREKIIYQSFQPEA